MTIRRDDKPGIPFPGRWDLPGGGREGSESPADCALRELREELGIAQGPAGIVWQRAYPGYDDAARTDHLLVGTVTAAEIAGARLGNEGRAWRTMPLFDFLSSDRAVPHLQARVRDFLADARRSIPERVPAG